MPASNVEQLLLLLLTDHVHKLARQHP